MPEPAKFESAPPVAVTSPSTKFEEASLMVKVMEAVSPDFKAEAEEVMVIVGATVSTVMES